jgi:hypothetical protein
VKKYARCGFGLFVSTSIRGFFVSTHHCTGNPEPICVQLIPIRIASLVLGIDAAEIRRMFHARELLGPA